MKRTATVFNLRTGCQSVRDTPSATTEENKRNTPSATTEENKRKR
jgi:hypothetical protein